MIPKIFPCICLMCITVLLFSGCDAALTLGGRTIGVSSGNFIFTDGYLTGSYNFPISKVWKSCEKTLTDMKASDIEKNMKISTGSMTALIQDDNLQITVEYVSPKQTSVSVRVGMAGNNLASQLIHKNIAANLLKPADEK